MTLLYIAATLPFAAIVIFLLYQILRIPELRQALYVFVALGAFVALMCGLIDLFAWGIRHLIHP